ncbi:MAG: hypothetical protein M1819_006521 [Sarea resinae]|nr:MAG: hypothetical protein M1819_000613 [Sarea resinae]KAI9828814.1 MAG: hypothetical protein M1819_006521 [Sarea resinae]
MDSMRSLNTSLPNPSSPNPRTAQPPEQLLQAFKSAALSVTNLYKTAASDQARARQSGYQEALDELLTFLDKENLGLGDGEGWRVRRWATERLDGTGPHNTSDSDDERETIEKRARSSSPVIQRKQSVDLRSRPTVRSESPVRTDSAPPSIPTTTVSASQNSDITSRPEIFTFRSAHTYPQDATMEGLDQDGNASDGASQLPTQTSNASTPSVRVELVPRHSRSGVRHSVHSNRTSARSSAPSSGLGNGAGFKRRIPLDEFFDIGSFGNGKDGFGGGGKRSRFT